jgi:hypothetical protein
MAYGQYGVALRPSAHSALVQILAEERRTDGTEDNQFSKLQRPRAGGGDVQCEMSHMTECHVVHRITQCHVCRMTECHMVPAGPGWAAGMVCNYFALKVTPVHV